MLVDISRPTFYGKLFSSHSIITKSTFSFSRLFQDRWLVIRRSKTRRLDAYVVVSNQVHFPAIEVTWIARASKLAFGPWMVSKSVWVFSYYAQSHLGKVSVRCLILFLFNSGPIDAVEERVSFDVTHTVLVAETASWLLVQQLLYQVFALSCKG